MCVLHLSARVTGVGPRPGLSRAQGNGAREESLMEHRADDDIRRVPTGRGEMAVTAAVGQRLDHHLLVAAVADRLCCARPVATSALRATLETLGETLLPREARELGDRLPPELAPYVASGTRVQRTETLGDDEFLRRVAVRLGDPAADPRRSASTVLALIEARTGIDVPYLTQRDDDPVAGDTEPDDLIELPDAPRTAHVEAPKHA